jgi:hypothetical protein
MPERAELGRGRATYTALVNERSGVGLAFSAAI